MAPVRVARAFRLPIIAAMTALALSGCMRRTAPVAVAPQPTLDTIAYAGPAPVPVGYAAPAPVSYDVPYHLDAGDRLRVVVYGQEGLTNTYSISAGGTITMPLIGSVPARGRTPQGLAADITARLRNGFIREPSVAVEVESYRPFFILGEVQAPGQYPYVPNMTVESAVAIAGGFSPRARKDRVTITHTDAAGTSRAIVPPGTPLSPGDTVLVGERWF
jgi:polysaccharide biosynthesis/export protein